MELLKSDVNGYYCPDDPGEAGGSVRLSVNDVEARILKELFRGRIVLEIGTGLGVSTRAIAETADFVHTVDTDVWVRKNITLPNNVKIYADINLVPQVESAFIDGLHSYEQCRKDIQDCKRLVIKGGLIVLHDAKIEEVFRAIQDEKVICVPIITYAGLAVGWSE